MDTVQSWEISLPQNVEKQHADGENFPGGILAHQAHENVMRVAATEFGNVADVQRKQGDVFPQVWSAELNVGRPVGSGATNFRPARQSSQRQL